MTERRLGRWTLGAIACGGLSVVSFALAASGVGDLNTLFLFLGISILLFVSGVIAAIAALLTRQRGGRVVALVFGLVIAAGAANYLVKTGRERARVNKYVVLVEQSLSQSPNRAITEKWGRFLRIEGSGYECPPFMSPGGDYFVARRMAHFERGSTSLRVYVPGLTDKGERVVPGFQIDPQGNVILVNF